MSRRSRRRFEPPRATGQWLIALFTTVRVVLLPHPAAAQQDDAVEVALPAVDEGIGTVVLSGPYEHLSFSGPVTATCSGVFPTFEFGPGEGQALFHLEMYHRWLHQEGYTAGDPSRSPYEVSFGDGSRFPEGEWRLGLGSEQALILALRITTAEPLVRLHRLKRGGRDDSALVRFERTPEGFLAATVRGVARFEPKRGGPTPFGAVFRVRWPEDWRC